MKWCTGGPRKNVPLGEGKTNPKGTFFLGHLVYSLCLVPETQNVILAKRTEAGKSSNVLCIV